MKYGKPAVTFEFACHWHLVHQRNAMAFAARFKSNKFLVSGYRRQLLMDRGGGRRYY